MAESDRLALRSAAGKCVCGFACATSPLPFGCSGGSALPFPCTVLHGVPRSGRAGSMKNVYTYLLLTVSRRGLYPRRTDTSALRLPQQREGVKRIEFVCL